MNQTCTQGVRPFNAAADEAIVNGGGFCLQIFFVVATFYTARSFIFSSPSHSHQSSGWRGRALALTPHRHPDTTAEPKKNPPTP